MRSTAGFSIAEIIVVLGITGVMAAVSLGGFAALRPRESYVQAVGLYTDALYEARLSARTMEHNESWGVYVASGTITVFAGDTYIGRTPGLDAEYFFDSSVSVSGDSEVRFLKFSAEPTAAATTTFATPYGGRSVIIDSTGIIYETDA